MIGAIEHGRDATEEEIEQLRGIAFEEHARLGVDHPSDLVIEIRVRSLARERGLTIPGASEPPHLPARPRRSMSPDYLQAGLEQKAQQCAVERRQARTEKHIRIVRQNTDRFYLFCFLKGGFARALCSTRALEVLAAVLENASGDVETWVSIAVLARRLGRTQKTVSKALRALGSKEIVSLIDASTVHVSLNGRPVRKKQGYVIRLHAPMFWDWDSMGGVSKAMAKYLADYEEPVDNSGDPGNGYGGTPVTVTTDF